MKSKSRIYAIIAISALALALPSSFINSALAASPHFIGNPTCTVQSDHSLQCNGKIAGLGNVSTVTANLVADVTAHFACSATVFGQAQTFTVNNGQITFPPPTVGIPAPTSSSCSPVTLQSVTYANVKITVDGTTLPIGGPFTG